MLPFKCIMNAWILIQLASMGYIVMNQQIKLINSVLVATALSCATLSPFAAPASVQDKDTTPTTGVVTCVFTSRGGGQDCQSRLNGQEKIDDGTGVMPSGAHIVSTQALQTDNGNSQKLFILWSTKQQSKS